MLDTSPIISVRLFILIVLTDSSNFLMLCSYAGLFPFIPTNTIDFPEEIAKDLASCSDWGPQTWCNSSQVVPFTFTNLFESILQPIDLAVFSTYCSYHDLLR